MKDQGFQLNRLMVPVCMSVRLFIDSAIEKDYVDGLRDYFCDKSVVRKLVTASVV
jgi:hypothetical protein